VEISSDEEEEEAAEEDEEEDSFLPEELVLAEFELSEEAGEELLIGPEELVAVLLQPIRARAISGNVNRHRFFINMIPPKNT
jgi:hypothetical protein